MGAGLESVVDQSLADAAGWDSKCPSLTQRGGIDLAFASASACFDDLQRPGSMQYARHFLSVWISRDRPNPDRM